jgi:glycosyltransferase involved in cell wall biosynthesis
MKMKAARAPRGPVLLLGGVGTLVPWKRWHFVIEAFHALPEGVRSRLRFVHIGGPNGTVESEHYAADLRKQTRRRGLESCVIWRGQEAGADVLLREIDCLLIAAHREPFSVAMLEALAAGVPVLAAKSGGAGDLILHGRNGWLFAEDDPGELVRSLTTLVTTDALQHVRIYPEQMNPFLAPVVAARWAESYARVIAAAPP